MIIGSYHKTGSVLFSNIWKDYFNKKQYYKDYNNFNSVTNDMIKNNKCIVLIRNPYEIIMSGVRYHQITNEKWCNIKDTKYNGLSYKKYIQKLNFNDKIIFEMENCAYKTINAIYNDMKNRNFNNNILFIKLEDLYEKKNIPNICEKIKNHCESFINIDSNKLAYYFFKNLNKSFHRTNKNNSYTFNEYFKEQHINHFNKLFPKDTCKIIGYDNEFHQAITSPPSAVGVGKGSETFAHSGMDWQMRWRLIMNH